MFRVTLPCVVNALLSSIRTIPRLLISLNTYKFVASIFEQWSIHDLTRNLYQRKMFFFFTLFHAYGQLSAKYLWISRQDQGSMKIRIKRWEVTSYVFDLSVINILSCSFWWTDLLDVLTSCRNWVISTDKIRILRCNTTTPHRAPWSITQEANFKSLEISTQKVLFMGGCKAVKSIQLI